MMQPFEGHEEAKAEKRRQEEILRVLRRLCEAGAVLAVAQEMEKAVVVRETGEGQARTAVVDQEIVQVMALNEWIHCARPGKLSRYVITAAGRGELNRLVAAEENRATGFADAQAGFAGPEGAAHQPVARFSAMDSPLAALARRRDKNGSPFLTSEQVAAGERLREDYELALMAGVRFDTVPGSAAQAPRAEIAGEDALPGAARRRVENALADLGEGLADVALRCCCYLEGLETAEKRLGWSARSGKIVLRIALMRLSDFYHTGSKGEDARIG